MSSTGMTSVMCEFEEKVKKNLLACGVCPDSQKIGLAVSGGADSVSLLLAMSSFLSTLYVITVNHNIRPAAEAGGDARFVSEFCQKLEKENGKKINCTIIELPRGSVEAEAQKRGRGTEDAARSLRYEAFERFISQNQLDVLCLAHNRNDQLETILMRFLQGASFDSAGGIRARRGPYIRPLLNISRSEIESYLSGLGISWRTDKTNFETDYLRNKIRLKLLPFLDENFEGWQTAALKGAEKNAEDAEFIQSCLEDFQILQNADGSVELSLDDFMQAPGAVKYRLLLEACNRAGESRRIPHQFLKDVITCQNSSFTKRFGGVEISRKNNQLFIKKYSESNTDLVFFDIIEESGTFEFPFGNLYVYNYREQKGKGYVDVRAEESGPVENIPLPFCVRSARPGDTVLSARASEKKVSDIFSDWHLPPEKRSLLPVIQLLDENPQRIIAVLGGFLGYKDWIVKR